jgi:methionyl-tRNA synthetase
LIFEVFRIENKGFYITSSIPYVNAPPHVGFALELIQADVIARYNRIKGNEVFFLTGADENSLKNVKAAEKLNVTTQQLVDKNSSAFRDLAKSINASCDTFARSSIVAKDEHWPGVYKLWDLIEKSGDIYKKNYTGLYCVGCEQFYKESELVNGLCPEHLTKPELVEEENYFFRLSKYQNELEELISSNKIRITPEQKKNEVLGFIKEGLEDISISRSVTRAKGWGIPVQNDSSQIVYVWLDALALYITGIGYGIDENRFKKWWPADLHVIGKGIIKFHALYWPAFLLSAKIELPRNLLVHGYITIEKQKISKSLGNVIDPLELLKRYSADELRYYLMKDIPTFDDGDFSEAALKDRINKELLGDLGNLVNRVLTLVENSKITAFEGQKELEEKINIQSIEKKFDSLELHNALNEIMDFVRYCNKYVNDKKPWAIEGRELEGVLYNLLEAIRVSSILLYPFIPETSEKIAAKLGTKITKLEDCKFRERFEEKVTKGDYLFKKIE